MLAAHDSDADRRLDFQEFTSFMTQFMSAAGFLLHEVLEDLIALTQTKVRLCWISCLYCFFFGAGNCQGVGKPLPLPAQITQCTQALKVIVQLTLGSS